MSALRPIAGFALLGVALSVQTGCDDYVMPSASEEAELVPDRVLARLNRTEYDHTVRDLFGTTMRPSRDFPADDFDYGFDNIAGTLSVSPLHVELYTKAAHELVSELYGERVVTPSVWRIEAEELAPDAGALGDGGWVLFGDDALTARVWVPDTGSYTVAALLSSVGGELATVSFRVDGDSVVEASVGPEQRLEVTMDLEAGYHTLSVHFLDAPAPSDVDEDLFVDVLEVTGPFDVLAPPPALASEILSCTPGGSRDDGEVWTEPRCAEHIVGTFGRRAWRRPLSEAELEAQMTVYGDARAAGGDFDDGVGAALEALLVSPYFLYRVELDPVAAEGELAKVDSYAMASRLSYFLWSSMPDERLLDLASRGMLLHDEVLSAEVDRMLDDPRATALVDDFGAQWLGLRTLDLATPDPSAYPEVSDGLRRAMRAEMQALIRSVFLDDRPVSDLLVSTDAVLEPVLADFYGGDEVPRPGILTRAGWLMATSHPTRTSPVKRGAWVLDKILCSPPPPAPVGVPALPEEGGGSMIEQMEAHRADPACASCHLAMDPIGIGLETFDAIGRSRQLYADGQSIDVAGQLQSGGTFETTAQLLELLASDPRFEACAAQQTFTYAMGRAPEGADDVLLKELESGLRADDSFRELVRRIVLSDTFRTRRVGGTP